MRILIKGGVWKNTEDEILKAAVMKYGKNQWARVASLLSRKSARQCKARWYEWLDPSIKKTEWSKDEDEKLLHLAKLMPNQWRTIAPIVGRTAGQCMEQYEKLLDQAQEGAAGEPEDPRRLRPGEIDPTPETKPARPDPIDMDEDEKEMLSEARARLANTKGKKAKRKARERQLDESKRLSMLQKRRELKAAGIESKLGGMRKRKYIDYAKEIPFQKLAPAGFYDTGAEAERAKTMGLDPVLNGLELSRLESQAERDEEQKEKQKDKKRLKTLFKANAPLAVMSVSAAVDPTTLRHRRPLNLPAPQVSDNELEEIVKMGQQSLMPPPEGMSAATHALIGDYSQATRSTPTPLRTPLQENIIMQEARNLRALRDVTPFSDSELPEMASGGTGFEGINPRNAKLATPNTMLAGNSTPLTTTSSSALVRSGSGNATPMSLSGRTPLRDQFGLNDGASDMASVSDMVSTSSRMEKIREKEQKARLAAQLRGLPEPEYTYEVSVPTVEDEDAMEEVPMTEDAADVLARQQEVLAEEILAEERRRSTVIRRELPRPLAVTPSLAEPCVAGEMSVASALIDEEMVRLLAHDEYRFPVPNAKTKKSKTRPVSVDLEEIDDADLQLAREMINAEVIAGQVCAGVVMSVDDIAMKLDDAIKNIIFLPTRGNGGTFAHSSTASKPELLAALSTQFESLKSRLDKDAKKAMKLEQKLQVVTQGYASRSSKIESSIKASAETLDNASIEL
eukprot:gene11533-24126_t